MNDSLLTYSGGQPLYADDLSFMQNSLSVMTNHLAKAFGDTYIVWGCLDEAKENVIAGAVCIGGKLYEVPALGLLGENKLCYREVQSDEREFEDGQRHNVKKSYEAYLSTDTSGSVAYIDLKTARNVSSWTQEQWDDTPTIDLAGLEDNGWIRAEIKRLRLQGGWLYFVSMEYDPDSSAGGSATWIGTIKGVRLNNHVSVSGIIDYKSTNTKLPVLITIDSYEEPWYTGQSIAAVIPSSGGDWFDSPDTLKKEFLLQFSFFDPDVKLTYNN